MTLRLVLAAAAATVGIGIFVTTQSTASAEYPPAASESATTTAPESAPIGTSVAVATVVRDEHGQPVANQACSFAIVSQPGTGASLSSTTATTNEAGVATVDLNVGTASGEIVVESTCGNIVSRTGVVAGVSTGPASQLPSTGVGPRAAGAGTPVVLVVLAVMAALLGAKALRAGREMQ